MIEKITLALINESGDVVPIKQGESAGVKIDVAIGELISQINSRINSIDDQEIRTAEKFTFALKLKNHLQEIKNYAD